MKEQTINKIAQFFFDLDPMYVCETRGYMEEIEEEEENETCYYYGKIFEAGEYPDKNFSITPDELYEATRNFTPVLVNYSHEEGPLDGKMGLLTNIWCSDDHKILYGGFQIPVLLKKLIGNTILKCSCEWTYDTKRLVGIALCNNPRIPDAILQTFSLLQLITGKQSVASFVGKRHSTTDAERVQSIHDVIVALGANCPQADMKNSDSDEDTPASKSDYNQPGNNVEKDKKGANFTMPTEPTKDTQPPATTEVVLPHTGLINPQVASFKDSPEYLEMQRTLQLQNQQLEALHTERRHNLAVGAFDKYLGEKKVTPAERFSLVAALEQAMFDDEKNGAAVVKFSDGTTQSSRLQVLRLAIESRPGYDHLMQEQVSAFALPTGATPQSAAYNSTSPTQNAADFAKREAEEVTRILGMTSMGRDALKNRATA